MAKKQERRRLTADLNLELTKIDTVLSIGSQFVNNLPEGKARRALRQMINDGQNACARGHELVVEIGNQAKTI